MSDILKELQNIPKYVDDMYYVYVYVYMYTMRIFSHIRRYKVTNG